LELPALMQPDEALKFVHDAVDIAERNSVRERQGIGIDDMATVR
jgi:hypothetical protein